MKRLFPVSIGFLVMMFTSSSGWCLPPCADTTAKSIQETRGWDNCFGTLYFEIGRFKGDKYVGQFKDGKGHGQGTYTWVYNDKYVGEFKYGKAHGQGIFTKASGKVYKGIFENGRFLNLKKP